MLQSVTRMNRAELISVFSSAISLRSFSGSPKPELAAIVFANAAEIIGYFSSRVQHWPYELRQKVNTNYFGSTDTMANRLLQI